VQQHNRRVAAANRYLAQLAVLGAQLRVADARFVRATAGGSLPANALAAPALARAAAAYAAGVGSLTPPVATVQAPQAALIAAARDFAAELAALARAARAGNPAAAIAASRRASKLTTRLELADNAVRATIQHI
jgi:hypothetical protein